MPVRTFKPAGGEPFSGVRIEDSDELVFMEPLIGKNVLRVYM
jgi:hypothetical protein